MTDVLKAIRAASRLETILRKKYRADGIALGSKLRSVQSNLKPEIVQQIEYISHVRNVMAHNNVNHFEALGKDDEKKFYDTCASLEAFFNEKILIDSDETNPVWIDSVPVSWWPKTMVSSREKRLFYYVGGDIKVCQPGGTKLTTLRGITEAGHVCMTPQSLPEMEVEPLISKDRLTFLMVLSMSVTIGDILEKIRLVIFNAEEQLEKLRKQVMLTLQGICVENLYDELLHSRHEVADVLKTQVNSRANLDDTASFLISDCTIIECELADNEINAMRRAHLHASEEARKREEELKHTAHIEKFQLQTMKEKTELENLLALEMKKHELEVFNLKAEADTALIRRKAEVDLELAVKASKQQIEIYQNKAKADIEVLNVVKAKAEIAATPAGKHALYPDDSFDVEKRRLNLEYEIWKAKFSDKKMQQILEVVATAGLNQTQAETLREFLGQSFNVALTERPAALPEKAESKITSTQKPSEPANEVPSSPT